MHLLGDELHLLRPKHRGALSLTGHRDLSQIEQLVPALFGLIYVFVLINKLAG